MIKKRVRKSPSYRLRHGYDQAIVTLTDSVSKERRDYWLGEYGTPASREMYHQILAEWEANDRRLPEKPGTAADAADGPRVNEVMVAYWRWAQKTYTGSEISTTAQIIRIMRKMFGSTPAHAFGPRRLRLVREAMINGDPEADPPRRPWSRPHINKQVHRLCFMFKWAAGQEMIPIAVYHQLATGSWSANHHG